MRRVVACFLGLSLVTGVCAQTSTVVVPAANANTEGNSLEAKPFATNQVRAMQLLDGSMVNVPFGRRITELAYRRDKTALPTETLSRFNRNGNPAWSVRLGNLRTDLRDGLAVNPRDPSGIFMPPGTGVQNTLFEVYNAVTSFPDLPPVTGATAPFQVVFKLQRPFLYTGPHGLAIDHYVFSSIRGEFAYFIDAERSAVDTGKATPFGTSCPSGKNRAYTQSSNPGGEPLTMILFDGPTQSAAVGILGASNTTWGPFPLPLDLTAAALPGCSIYVSLDILMPVATFSNGSAELRLQIPADPAFAGLRLFTQWLAVDPRVNPGLAVAFSDASDVKLGTTVGKVGTPASLVYGWGNLANGRYGLVDKGLVLITRIGYQ